MNISTDALKMIAQIHPSWLTSPEAFVMVALAHFARYEEIRPNVPALVQITKLSKRSVIRALADLERKGFITVEHYRPVTGSRRQTNRYWFTDWHDEWCQPVTNADEPIGDSQSTIGDSVAPQELKEEIKGSQIETLNGFREEESKSIRRESLVNVEAGSGRR